MKPFSRFLWYFYIDFIFCVPAVWLTWRCSEQRSQPSSHWLENLHRSGNIYSYKFTNMSMNKYKLTSSINIYNQNTQMLDCCPWSCVACLPLSLTYLPVLRYNNKNKTVKKWIHTCLLRYRRPKWSVFFWISLSYCRSLYRVFLYHLRNLGIYYGSMVRHNYCKYESQLAL